MKKRVHVSDDPIIKAGEVAEILGLQSTTQVYALFDAGRLPGYAYPSSSPKSTNRIIRFRHSDVIAFRDKHYVTARKSA